MDQSAHHGVFAKAAGDFVQRAVQALRARAGLMPRIEQSQLHRVFAFQLMDLNAGEPGPFRHRDPLEQTYRGPCDGAAVVNRSVE